MTTLDLFAEQERPPPAKERAATQPERGPLVLTQSGTQYIHPEPPRKWARILKVFLTGRSLNRFEAEPLGDHCLHSTVSRIESMGVTIARHEETVRGYRGCETRVKRYYLSDPLSREHARRLLGRPPA